MAEKKNDRRQADAEGENPKHGKIREGMDVIGEDGVHIGQVLEVRDLDFLVDRTNAYDVYIPFDACGSVENEITLNVSANEVDAQGWSSPERLDTPIIQSDLNPD